MKIDKEHIDDVNVVVSVNISGDDYSSKVLDILREHRRKAKLPGFRPGKVPEGMIRKMYGKAVLIDEINKLVSETLQNYFNEQKINTLGDPIPRASGDDIEWEIGNDFNFEFEVGLSPEFEVKLSKDDQLTKYKVIVEQEMIDKDIENYTGRFGQYMEVDSVTDFSERITGDIVQLNETGEIMPDGLSAEDTSLFISLIRDENIRKPFNNAKIGDEIVFNLAEMFPNKYEIASILKKNQSEVGDISASQFRFTIKQIHKYVKAEINQELFDKIFGNEVVKSRKEFEKRMREKSENEMEDRTYAKFKNDFFDYLLEKLNLQLPEDFLRKRLIATGQEMTDEQFEADFPFYLKNIATNLIANQIIKQYDIKVEEQEVIDTTKEIIRKQYALYHVLSVTEEDIVAGSNQYLQEENNVRSIMSQVFEKKITDIAIENVDLTIQEISLNDFTELLSPKLDSN